MQVFKFAVQYCKDVVSFPRNSINGARLLITEVLIFLGEGAKLSKQIKWTEVDHKTNILFILAFLGFTAFLVGAGSLPDPVIEWGTKSLTVPEFKWTDVLSNIGIGLFIALIPAYFLGFLGTLLFRLSVTYEALKKHRTEGLDSSSL
jgi:hypothetical protein